MARRRYRGRRPRFGRRGRWTPRFRRRRGRGLGRFGLRGGLLSFIAGAAGLTLARRFIPNFAGVYQGPVDNVITGVALNAIGLDNMDLASAGVKEGISTLIDSLIAGRGMGIGGGGGAITPMVV